MRDLLRAQIVIMVLTGDKQETAVSIAKSSSIVNENTQLLYINEDTESELEGKMRVMTF